MAKQQPNFGGGGKLRTRTLHGSKGKRPDLAANAAPSNPEGDKQAQLIFIGLSVLSALLVGGALYWSVSTLISGINHGHINWGPVAAGAITIGMTMFLARTLAWLSYFGAMMFAMKTSAWQSQERLCRSALKRWKIFPGGSATAALMLVQSLVTRGAFDEAIEVGEQQFKLHGEDPKFNESLSPMYTALGMAFQVKGDPRSSITWTDRGIEAMQRALDGVANKKTWQAKLAGPQGVEWAKSLKMQLCVAYFNNASSYFNLNNYRQAKQFYKQALDWCSQAPDFPEKADIIKVSREQLSRLKHA